MTPTNTGSTVRRTNHRMTPQQMTPQQKTPQQPIKYRPSTDRATTHRPAIHGSAMNPVRPTQAGLDDRPAEPPSLSTTTEREHVVFTRNPALERELSLPPARVESGVSPNPAEDFLLGQPKHLADRLPCRVGDADLWFADIPSQLDQAKALCGECPARRACLAGALARREPWGVWGGEIFDHGAIIARKRPRGRPRKDEVAA